MSGLKSWLYGMYSAIRNPGMVLRGWGPGWLSCPVGYTQMLLSNMSTLALAFGCWNSTGGC